MVRLRSAGLTKSYRKSLRESGVWLLGLVQELGKTWSASDGADVVDKWLERAVEVACKRKERLYRANLGLVAIQCAFHLSAPLLRGAWSAVRGWKALKPSKSRIPITRYRLECLVVVALSGGWAEEGWMRRRWVGCALGWWLGFVCLLRLGEIMTVEDSALWLDSGGLCS